MITIDRTFVFKTNLSVTLSNDTVVFVAFNDDEIRIEVEGREVHAIAARPDTKTRVYIDLLKTGARCDRCD